MLRTFFFIGVGSFAGGVFRYACSRFVQTHFDTVLPWGTLVVNVSGCFMLGLLYGLFERNFFVSNDLRLLLTVGLCGGFTTFSTFMHENYALLDERNMTWAVLYSMLSLGLGLLCTHCGHWLVKAV